MYLRCPHLREKGSLGSSAVYVYTHRVTYKGKQSCIVHYSVEVGFISIFGREGNVKLEITNQTRVKYFLLVRNIGEQDNIFHDSTEPPYISYSGE